MNDKIKTGLTGLAALVLTGAGIGIGVYLDNGLIHLPYNTNPAYVNPRDVKGLPVKDRDADGKPETYIKIKNREFLLKYDNNDLPQIYPFRIVPYKVEKSTK